MARRPMATCYSITVCRRSPQGFWRAGAAGIDAQGCERISSDLVALGYCSHRGRLLEVPAHRAPHPPLRGYFPTAVGKLLEAVPVALPSAERSEAEGASAAKQDAPETRDRQSIARARGGDSAERSEAEGASAAKQDAPVRSRWPQASIPATGKALPGRGAVLGKVDFGEIACNFAERRMRSLHLQVNDGVLFALRSA